MARLIRKTETHSFFLDGKKICMCGLSKTQPFCDSTHKKIAGEEEGALYEYDSNGNRRKVRIVPAEE